MKTTSNNFTPGKLLTKLAVISFTLALPFNAFAAPEIRVRNAAEIIQVKDSLRQISEAANRWEKAGGCSMWACTEVDQLVAAGKLTIAPQVPANIGTEDSSPPFYSATEGRIGGCGPKSSGAAQTTNIALKNVSEQFCKDYNKSVGLGSTIVENCVSGGGCTASGSTNYTDLPLIKNSSFCYRRGNSYAVVWMATVSGPACNKH